MTWNYRIIEHKDKKVKDSIWYGLHEVFYDEDGKEQTYCVQPQLIAEDPKEFAQSLGLMMKDVRLHFSPRKHRRKDILHEKDFEKGGKFYLTLLAFEQETQKEIEEATSTKLPKPTNAKGNSKNPRRKPRSRNK